jgi:hypothetical protein
MTQQRATILGRPAQCFNCLGRPEVGASSKHRSDISIAKTLRSLDTIHMAIKKRSPNRRSYHERQWDTRLVREAYSAVRNLAGFVKPVDGHIILKEMARRIRRGTLHAKIYHGNRSVNMTSNKRSLRR